MLKSKIKYFFWAIPFICLMMFVFFWQPIFSSFVQYSAKQYCKRVFGTHFCAESSVIENNKWVLTDVKISSSKQKDLHVDIKKVIISVEPFWFKRELDLALVLVEPQISVAEQTTNLQEMIIAWFAVSGFFNVNPKVVVQNGTVDLESTQKIFFQGEIDTKQSSMGQFHVYFEQPNIQQNFFNITLRKNSNDSVALDFLCSSIECPKIFPILKIISTNLEGWSVREGILDGKGTINLEKMSGPTLNLKAAIHQLVFSHAPTEFEGKIPDIHINFDDEHLKGEIAFLEGASLNFQQNGISFFSSNHLTGRINLFPDQKLDLLFNGVCNHQQDLFTLQISGKGHFHKDGFFELNIVSETPQREPSIIRMIARQSKAHWKSLELELQNLNQKEFELLKPLYQPYLQKLGNLRLKEGKLHASIVASLEENKIKNLIINKLTSENLKIGSDEWGATAEIGRLVGSLELNLLNHHLLQALNADLSVENGLFQWTFSEGEPLVFKDISTRLQIDQSKIRNSDIKASLGGLKGQIAFDWFNSRELMKLNFSGDIKDLIAFIPSEIKQTAGKLFNSEEVLVLATVSKDIQKFDLAGTIQVSTLGHLLPEAAHFGFDVHTLSPHDSILPLKQESNLKFEEIKKILPSMLLPIAFAQQDALEREKGISGLALTNGWFEAKDVPLEKYVSPLIFTDGKIKLSGRGDFQGKFDHKSLSLQYDGHEIIIESEDVILSLDHIEKDAYHPAQHFFDFIQKTNFGYIPVRNGSYFEKNSGLLFTDINGIALFEGKKIHFPHLDCFCTGIHFLGALDIDYSSPEKGVFDANIYLHSMDGKFSQVQHLFSHFPKPSFFMKFPLEGLVSFKGEGGYMRFEFSPGNYNLFAKVQGTLSEGTMRNQKGDLNLHELSLDFEYDHEGNYLNLTDIQGTLLVGNPDHVEEYVFSGDHVNFFDYTNDEAEFDFWVGDRQRDIIRVVGKTTHPKEEGIKFTFDRELTHFGDVYPEIHITLKDWEEIQTFELQTEFKLGTLFHDIQRFSRTGFLFLSRSFLKELNELKNAGGNFSLHMSYKPSTLNFHVKGEEVSIGEKQFKNVTLKGRKSDHVWMIDQLQLDNISVSTEFLKTAKGWKINFAGLRFGEALLLGLDGEIPEELGGISANINLLEIDLALLNERISFDAFRNFAPKGNIRAKGKMYFELGKGSAGIHIDALVNASFRSCEMQGLKLQDAENVSCHFVTDKGITIRNLSSALVQNDGLLLTSFNLDKGYYDFISKQFIIDGFHFKLLSDALDNLTSTFQKTFPERVTPSMLEIINDVKAQKAIEGNLFFDLSYPHYSLRLALKDGVYAFRQRKHDLQNFLIDLSPEELKIITKYRYAQSQFWVLFQTETPFFDSGQLTLSNFSPDIAYQEAHRPPLTISWENDETYGFLINKAEGGFSGIDCHLWANPEMPFSQEAHYLKGIVKINMNEAIPLLSGELGRSLREFQVGNGYALKGHWKFAKENPEATEFQGVLEGRNFEFKGYQFENLTAHLKYLPGSLEFVRVNLMDQSGALYIDQAKCYQDDRAKWKFSIPSVLVNDFRPIRLRSVDTSASQPFKPLVISQLDLSNVEGELGNSQSFKGQGKLFFSNPPKKHISPLLAIPAEIIARIGLDLSVLNPVSGSIYFQLYDSKVLLTKFKDVYSDGKLSRFYLADTEHPSYMDFEGNLYVQVRMKQYNLLFKLAELFTVTIQGNVRRPTYSLQKQPKREHSPAEQFEIVTEND